MANTYTLIASSIVGSGGATTITFSSIPSTYTDLLVKASLRNDRSAVAEDYGIFFNGDTTSGNYSAKELLGSGSAASSRSAYNYGLLVVSNNSTANTFGNLEVYIPNYAGSAAKSASVDAVTENNATEAYAGLTARLWTGTAAITSITIDKGDSGVTNTFLQYSTAYLYGISSS